MPKIKLNSDKVSLVLNHCLKPLIQEDLETKLTRKHFALILDETTDRSRVKQLGLSVQLWNFSSYLIFLQKLMIWTSISKNKYLK